MEKAFDRCSWEFLIKGLKEIGFDSTFTDYIKLAYSFDHPPSRQMYVNGFLGPSFQLGSGVAQGCPISPLLFCQAWYRGKMTTHQEQGPVT